MIIIPVYNSLILPGTKIHFSKADLEALSVSALHINDEIVFLVKKGLDKESHSETDDYYPIGITGNVISVDEEENASIEIKDRLDIDEVELDDQNVVAEIRSEDDDVTLEESNKKLAKLKRQILEYTSKFQAGIMAKRFIMPITSWSELAVSMAPYMNMTNDEKYEIMGADKKSERIDLITKAIQEFMTIVEVAQEANEEHTESYQKIYREDAIKKQMKFLQKQLDNMHPENKTQIQLLEDKIEKASMNEIARIEVDKVLNRLKQEGKGGHEYGILYDYLEFMTSLNWKKKKVKKIDLNKAEDILNKEHYGLDKAKKRIIEQLAVMALSKKQSGSILLFVGAPGTGKTSIAHSIASAIGREYVRISLGGVRDEAAIRGHRRTYIGAMPGRIMDGMQKSGVSNPVMLLDEIDKLSTSYNGDPASALLEVLDPEQNNTFTDHYMNVPYDLSDVLFICTANSLDGIPAPLLDRMEIIPFNGYTPLEKLQIGKEHLLAKVMKKNGITEDSFKIADEAIKAIISNYTMEAGVRGLKKQLNKLTRYAAVALVKENQKKVEVAEKDLADYLDQKPRHHEKLMETKEPGLVTGLAWTAVGGEILFIETMLTKGKGKIQITGKLGDVMKESVQIALSLAKKLYPDKVELFENNDIHIHVPAGATPKDGPSAGITLTTALVSLITGKAVSPEYAMTGEVSLRGNVMPIGGLPEKLMAAQRAGVKTVFIPKENEFDLKDVAPEVLEELKIIPVEKVTDVLEIVL